ncbi:hypothetical protein PGT21_014507 [Puccinia graminis f. sp. tritici]|uniref:Uncharacterized protein n=1 Tax=Puccinia graminis f. sp. tritici TaxID=56615 RepID=A0A5B0PU81_PUCGR|nr:hypothetical protein PGTUg99_036700 [Puccinia graminis f. sp. tritici]KAA1075668.1 hypothetical protein PGTUg99_034263 [Puccinia graminis f. sp. tritici]KAA1104194.1 hypothetical protein PGT21_014507 [Puccinia graminis f. sp. tritici]
MDGTLAPRNGSMNSDGKSEEENIELTLKILSIVRQRISSHSKDDEDDNRANLVYWLELRNTVPYELRQTILPRLHERIQSATMMLNEFDPTTINPDWWYRRFLIRLMDIAELVEQINSSILSIWTTCGPEQEAPHELPEVEHLTRSRCTRTEFLVQCLIKYDLDDLFGSFEDLFNGLRPTTSSGSLPTASQDSGQIIEGINRRMPPVVDRINSITQWLQEPLVNIAKADWTNMADMFEHGLFYSTYRTKFASEASFLQAFTTFLKFARLLVTKLPQSAPNQPLFFFGPLMDIEDVRLKILMYYSDKIGIWMSTMGFKIQNPHQPIDFREVATVLIRVIGGYSRFLIILERYWDSLLESDAPQVDPNLIVNARQWLNSWTPLFTLAARKVMQATGRLHFHQFHFELREAEHDDFLMED